MKIIKCHITNFGCYSDKTFEFSSKLNSFCLNNGEGKTTLAMFIKAMLYSLEKSSTKSYERRNYKPYSGGEYGGSLEIELNGANYRIERSFGDTPSKDTLKIFDSKSVVQSIFLTKKVALLQGEASAELGELILGIDSSSFQRSNFISSKDLDFSASESIKMKIGSIVIDKEHENSYEDTYTFIVENDLRKKAPTKKNEDAFPFQIIELEKKNREKQNEIEQLNQLEMGLKSLYEQRDNIKEELVKIEEKQKTYSYIHVQKGKMATVKEYENDISKETTFIEELNQRYDGNVPTKDEIESLSAYVKEYDKCNTKGDTYKITQSDVEKLLELEGKVVSDEDYTLMADAYSKISYDLNRDVCVQIDLKRYKCLKLKFEGKTIKDDSILEQEYYGYKSLIDQEKTETIYRCDIKDYPSENVLKHIDNEILEYNKLTNELEELKSSYREILPILKLLLIIITLGIYLFITTKKKKEYLNNIKEKESILLKKSAELDEFFKKYDKAIGTYDLKMAYLRDEISNFESSKAKNDARNKQHTELLEKLTKKKNELLTYFSFFGYMISDVDEAYNLYKEELNEYHHLVKDVNRNEKIYQSIQDNRVEQFSIIDNILSKYKMMRRDDFNSQLNEIKSNLEFYKKYNPIFINKKENDEFKADYKKKIIFILKNHNIEYENDFILSSKNVIRDFKNYNELKEKRVGLIEKKNRYIEENNLTGFTPENVEVEEEKLRNNHESKTAELASKEDEINQYESRIAKRESLKDEISNNNELIEEYKGKINIATIALKALEEAHSEMEAKFIDPIKDSFVSYANQIYEKIGSNVNMNYDYEIKYDVKGKLRDTKDLSDGERTIMMLALRFSVLDSMYKKHDSLIILDDPFESLDADKLVKAKELIKSLSNDWQIIYFTCHDSRAI